jgi:hypothetical protein
MSAHHDGARHAIGGITTEIPGPINNQLMRS